MPRKLTVGSCFSGIGGLELGLEWTGGFETKWQIENDPYASAVLAKHWPNVKRYGDIREVANPEPVDVICGGFPCQDVSLAGARSGLEGKRSTLWGEMHRLIREVGPRWVVAENVPGLFSSDDGRFFGNVLADLADCGFAVEWGVLSAAGAGAPHLRRRVFILANSDRDGRYFEGAWKEGAEGTPLRAAIPSGEQRTNSPQRLAPVANTTINRWDKTRSRQSIASSKDVADTQYGTERGWEETRGTCLQSTGRDRQWTAEPNVGRVAHGVPSRVDRLRCLGNSVVPQVAQKVGEMILAYEAKR